MGKKSGGLTILSRVPILVGIAIVTFTLSSKGRTSSEDTTRSEAALLSESISTTEKRSTGADDWQGVLKPVIDRYRGYNILRFFRGDAAFADPNVYSCLEAECRDEMDAEEVVQKIEYNERLIQDVQCRLRWFEPETNLVYREDCEWGYENGKEFVENLI